MMPRRKIAMRRTGYRVSRWQRAGTTAVEMALVLPGLLLLTIGLCVAELGAFRYHQVAALAHEGARWAAVHGKDYARRNGKSLATASDILENVIKPRAAGLDLSKVTHEITWEHNNALVTVKVNYVWQPQAFLPSRTFSCTAMALATY